jgi:methanogenic corrinoid protein MtbC1
MNVEEVVNRVREEKADVLGLSALLTTTMPEIKRVIDTLIEPEYKRLRVKGIATDQIAWSRQTGRKRSGYSR